MGRQRQLSFAVALALALIAGCGGSDDTTSADDEGTSPGSSTEFCRMLGSSFADADIDDDEGMAVLRTLAESAPDALRDDFDIFLTAIEKLDGLDENDPDAFDEVFAIALDPEMLAATTHLEEFATTECNLDPALFDADSADDMDDMDDMDDAPTLGDDAEIDPNEISLDGVQAYLDEQYGDTSWRSNVTGYTLFGDDELEVSGSDLEADAIEICAAVVGYAVPITAAATVKVTDDSGSVVHASNTTDDGSCQHG